MTPVQAQRGNISEMFTGIIEATAEIIEKTPDGLTVERPSSFDDVKIGSSISVSGVCLSIIELAHSSMRFNVVPETLSRTTIGEWKKGDRVNVERAMKSSDRFEGHMVQGHVEGTAMITNYEVRITNIRNPQSAIRSSMLALRVDRDLLSCIMKKGSIAIDGVSLTIVSIDGDLATVALIPHTIKNTTLGSLKKGDHVNIETDVFLRHM